MSTRRVQLAELIRTFEYVLEENGIHAESNFFAAGGDSLLAVRMISKLVQQFGVDLTFAEFTQVPTPKALQQLLNDQLDGCA